MKYKGPRGILIAADSISGDGEDQGYGEFVVTMDEDGDGEFSVDLRLNDKKDTIWTIKLAEVEDALRLLKKKARQ